MDSVFDGGRMKQGRSMARATVLLLVWASSVAPAFAGQIPPQVILPPVVSAPQVPLAPPLSLSPAQATQLGAMLGRDALTQGLQATEGPPAAPLTMTLWSPLHSIMPAQFMQDGSPSLIFRRIGA